MGGDSRRKWIFISFIIVYFQYFFVRINSVEMCSGEKNATDCCNCTHGADNGSQIIMCQPFSCDNTCPNGFFFIPEKVSSTYMPVFTTVQSSENSMTTTTSKYPTAATISQISTAQSPLISSTTETVKVLVCQKCHDICLTCNGSNTSCTRCHYSFNGSCVDKCPEGKEGENCTEIRPGNTESSQTLPIIIGASVGGVVLIAVIIIIIVFCLRHRNREPTSRNNKNGRSAMSGILQGRAEGGEKRDDDVTDSPSPHPIYENVERPNELGNQIQEQGDKILRYARDPTMMDKKKEPKQADPTRSSSYYENSATIRRQDNIQDINGVSGEHAELEQLGQAPLPPPVGQKKSKKSLKSRMSKKIKKLKGNVSTKTSPISDHEAQEDHYLPMGPMNSRPDLNKETSQDSQEVYEEMEDKLHQPPTLFIQENYENVEDVPSVSAPPPPLVEQEDYENIKDRFPVPERARTGQKSKGRMPDPPTEAKLSQTSPASGDDKLSKDYINVEKYRRSGPEISKKDDMTSQEAQEELEDYENVKHLSKKK